MGDLVKRLRDQNFTFEPPIAAINLLDEAASEIERLRAVNARYKDALDKIAQYDVQFIAISALRSA